MIASKGVAWIGANLEFALLRVFPIVALLIALAPPALAADPRKMSFSPVEFHPPKAERVVLDNGMILFLLADHELPLVRLEAMIRTGSIYEPADKIGLAGLTGAVMRTGGTAVISGDALDDELEFMAAEMSSLIGQDAGHASLDVLTKDLDRALSLFAGMLMGPAFAEDKFLLAQKQAIEEIRRRNDHPSGLATRRFYRQVYGADHPLGRESTAETVGRIRRDDLVEFHAKYYRPDAVILSVTGDFSNAEMMQKLKTAFSGWRPGRPELPKIPPVRDAEKTEVFIVPKEITQTHLRIGHLGVRQDDPDFFAVSLLDDILGGGGFRSRLFKDVRTKRGLAYSIGTAFTPGTIERGVFAAYGETKASSTHQTVAAVLEQIRKIRAEPVSEEELRLAQDAFLNSFVFSFTSSSQIAGRQAMLEYYGLPADYLERFRERVVRVTRGDLWEAAKKHLRPEGMVILAVGSAERFEKPLSDFGAVHTAGP